MNPEGRKGSVLYPDVVTVDIPVPAGKKHPTSHDMLKALKAACEGENSTPADVIQYNAGTVI
jgi:hypothetical protein